MNNVHLNLRTSQVSLGPLMFASKFVLVGDHYQLPPLVQVYILSFCFLVNFL